MTAVLDIDEDLKRMSHEALIEEVVKLREGIRAHRDSTMHELCWHHPQLWGLLPEKTDPLPEIPDWPQFLEGCLRYRRSLDEQLPDTPRRSKRRRPLMIVETPTAELAPRFSSPEARPVAWEKARRRLEEAELYWLSTVRPDGRPHVTPLIAVWLDGAMYFCTGADERKNKNIARSTHVILTTGCNSLKEGMDVVVEGDAIHMRDDALLQRVTGEYLSKYGEDWRFTVRDGAFVNPESGVALVYEIRPKTAFGFGKGEPYSQTRWRF